MSCIIISCEKPENNTGPEIVSISKDLIVLVGDTISSHCLSVEATDPDGDALSYQWCKVPENDLEPGIIISGATNNTYIPDKYFVNVSDSKIEVASDAIPVMVVDSIIEK